MAEAAKLQFTKLNGQNYFTWKFRMEHYLKGERLWHVITTEKPSPASGDNGIIGNQVAIDKWTENDELAFSRIVTCIDDSQVSHIRSVTGAKAAWYALKEYHEKDTMTNKVCIIRRICNTRLDDGGDMEQHLVAFTELFQRLADLGEKTVDSWKVGLLFGSLPKGYATLVTALESRPESDLTFTMVREKLTAEYKRQTEGEGGTQKDSVLKTTTANTGVECFFCKNRGHVKKDCRKFKAWKNQNEKDGSNDKDKNDGQQKANKVEDRENKEFLFIAAQTRKPTNRWIIDSGATCHVASNKNLFESIQDTKTDLAAANGQKIKVEGKGTCVINVMNDSGQAITVRARDVLFAPQLDGNLLSVRKLLDADFTVNFDGHTCKINKGDQQIALADEASGLYVLRQSNKVCVVTNGHKPDCIHNLHRIFGHRDPIAIRAVCAGGFMDGITITECGIKQRCEVCLKAKQTRLPFQKSNSKSTEVLDLIHTDVCGPMQKESPSGKKYILTLIDDFSRFTIIYLLREKSEVEEKLREYVLMVSNKFSRKPKVMRSDRGGEYIGQKVTSFFKSQGIQTQYTAPYTPQQNGVAERKNRTLIEMARCMIEDAGLPLNFWAEAVCTANYLQNRLPTRVIETTPYEKWNNKKPQVKHCVRFGSKCFVHIPTEKRRKLENTATEMIFVGYDEQSKAYRCFDRTKNKLVISRDVKFMDTMDPLSVSLASADSCSVDVMEPELNGDIEANDEDNVTECDNNSISSETEYESFADDDTDISISDKTLMEENQEEPTITGKRVSQRSTKGRPPKRLIEEINTVHEIREPKTLHDAMSSKQKNEWMCAMKEEMISLQRNGTWKLCKLPSDRTPIGCKWVYKLKTNSGGKIVRYKARLVAQGYSQKFGTDYDQVFAPVAKQTTFRILLTLASKNNFIVRHVDAKTAFLNGDLKETIFMKQPPGFEVGDDKVCLLQKSLYGLKQAARAWNDAIHSALMKARFQRNEADHCLYVRRFDDKWCYLLIYVDDMLIAAKTMEEINDVTDELMKHFDLEDLGDVKFYLGIEITKSNEGYYQLCQSTYINNIARDFGLGDAKCSNVPMNVNYGKSTTIEDDAELKNNTDYQRLIGCLLYVCVNTRPDIAASVSILAQKVSAPRNQDWNELKRVVRYLKGTLNLKLVLGNNKHTNDPIFGYADANWAEDRSDRKSNSGYIFIVYGAAVSWACRKQSCVALSTTEAEFIALSEACQEVYWLRRLLNGMNCSIDQPTPMFEDNQSCLKLIREEKLSNRTKHIDTRYNFVRDYVDKGIVSCEYCPTEQMMADIFTKPLPATKHRDLTAMIGLHD